MVTDIVITTYNRLDTLRLTLEYIWERTTPSTYRITVVDDVSKDSTREYLMDLQAAGDIYRAFLRPERLGATRYFDGMLELTKSDPLVFTDDDILCPNLEPDWLTQGLDAMKTHPDVGLLALNNPEANLRYGRALKQPGKVVTINHNVGGTFGFIRRSVLKDCAGIGIPVLPQIPAQSLCYRIWMHPKHWQVGYLTEVYCSHNETFSVRVDKPSRKPSYLVLPIDKDTLEPNELCRG